MKRAQRMVYVGFLSLVLAAATLGCEGQAPNVIEGGMFDTHTADGKLICGVDLATKLPDDASVTPIFERPGNVMANHYHVGGHDDSYFVEPNEDDLCDAELLALFVEYRQNKAITELVNYECRSEREGSPVVICTRISVK